MLCQGYNKSADYWAFGVLVYEMLVGYAPFASDSDRDRHNRILRATISFPDSFPPQGKDLVRLHCRPSRGINRCGVLALIFGVRPPQVSRLCVLDISRRLGMMAGGIAEIQSHAFFGEASLPLHCSHQIPCTPERHLTTHSFSGAGAAEPVLRLCVRSLSLFPPTFLRILQLKWQDVRNLAVKPPWAPRVRTLAELEKYHATLPQARPGPRCTVAKRMPPRSCFRRVC